MTKAWYVLGIACYWAWSNATIISASLWPQVGEKVCSLLWITNVSTHGLTLLLAALLATSIAKAMRRRWFYRSVPVVVMMGTLCLYVGFNVYYSIPLVLVGSVLSSVGNAGLLLIWGVACADLNSAALQRLVLSSSVAVGFVLALVVFCLPFPLSLISTLMLPLMAVFFTSKEGPPALEEESEETYTTMPTGRKTSLQLAICCLVFAIPAGLFTSQYSFKSWEGWTVVFSCAAFLISIFTAIDYWLARDGDSAIFSKMIVPFLAAGMLIFPYLAPGLTSIAGVLIVTGYHLFLVFIYSEICVFSRRGIHQTIHQFARVTCIIDFGLVIGSFLSAHIGTTSSASFTTFALGIAYLLLLVGVLLLPKLFENLAARAALELEERQNDMMPSIQLPDIAEQFLACSKSLAITYKLSNREAEILNLLVRGHNLKSIADETYLSYNTINE